MSGLKRKVLALVTTLTVAVWMIPGSASALTAEEIQAQIQALLQQIEQLQQQLAQIQGEQGVSGQVPAACEGITFSRHLKQGMSGNDVKCLQALLNQDPDTRLAESGVGSPGNETTYFGPLTKAAVIKFQEKYADEVLAPWGLTKGTGYVGDTTIAKLNSLLQAGATAEEQPAAEGEEEAAAEEEQATTTAEGPATVELAEDTPAAGSVALNAQDVIFTKIKFYGGAEGVTITKIVVTRSGISKDSDLTAIKLYEGETQIGSTQALNTLTHKAVFSSLNWEVPAGETKVLTIKGSIAAKGTATVGDSIILGIASADDITASTALQGTFPIYGNARTIAGISVGQLDVDVQATPAASTILSGSTEQEIASWKFTASNDEGFSVHKIVITHVGSATRDDVKNIKLMVDGVQIGETVEQLDSQNKATFDLSSSPLVINAGSSKTVHAYADIASGIWTSRTVIFEITQATDVVAYGNNSGGIVTITCNSGSTFTKQTGNTMTVGQGTLTVTVDAALNPASQNYVKGTEQRLFSAFKFSTGSREGVRITKLRLKINNGSGSATDIANVTLWDGSTQIAGPASVVGSYVTFGSNTVGWDETGLFDIPPSSNKTILVKADIPQGAVAGHTVDLDIVSASDIWADGLTSKYDIPQSSITLSSGNANVHTIVASGSLSISKASDTPSAQTYVKGSTEKVFLKFNLTAGSGEDVSVSSITINCYRGSGSACQSGDVTNVKLLKSDGSQYGSTVSSPAGTMTFSGSLIVPASETVTLSVVADIPASSNATSVYFKHNGAASQTSTGVSSSAEITESGSAQGNLITLGVGSLTVAAAATPGDQTLIIGSSEVPIAGLIFTAGTAEDVRVTYIKLTVSSSGEASTTDISNIALYDGDQQLTTKKSLTASTESSYPGTTHHTVSWSASDFLNSTGIEIPKGSQKTILVKVDLPTTGVSGHKIALGVSTTDDIATVGLSSNSDITETFVKATGATGVNYDYDGTASAIYEATLASSGTLTVENNSGTPVSGILAVGGEGQVKSGVVFHKVNFTANLEDIYIKQIVVERSGGRDADFASITLWDGDTQLGSAQQLVNGSSTFSFPEGSYWRIPKGTTKTLTIKADLNGIASQYGYGSQTGDAPKLGIHSIDAQGVSSGNDNITGEGVVDLWGNTQYLRKSKPSIASAALPSTTFGAGEKVLYRWTITADEKGDIGWKQITFSISGSVTYNGESYTVGCVGNECASLHDGVYMSTSTDPGSVKLIATSSMAIYDVGSGEQITATTTATAWTVNNANGVALVKFVAAQEQVIAAGTTKTYELRGVILTGGASGDSLITKLAATSTSPVSDTYSAVAATGPTITWTDRSGAGATHSSTSQDWTNDYKVDGLPTSALTLSR